MTPQHPGREIRTTDAIEQTSLVVLGTLTEPGTASPGPPGAHRIDGAKLRVDQVLTPAPGAPPLAGTYSLSYNRRVWPEAAAEAALKGGERYLVFCTVKTGKRLHALKIVPHSPDAVRVVAAAFGSGARHAGDASADRMA